MLKVLVVCSGNICRSPMGEVILQDMADAAGLPMQVDSAGTLDIDGAEASYYGVIACQEHGLDLESFRSTAISGVSLADYDQILVMEPHHEEHIRDMAGGARLPIHLVRKFSGEPEAISGEFTQVPDPVGQDLPMYQASFALIRRCMAGYVKVLKEKL